MRRPSWPLVCVIAGTLLVCALAYVLAPREASGVPLSPHNAGSEGSRAVAQVLGRNGVAVHSASTLEGARNHLTNGHSTLVITDPEDLNSSELNALLTSAHGERVVVVDPPSEVRDRLVASGAASTEGPVYPNSGDADRLIINDPDLLTNRMVTNGDNAQLALRALGHDPDCVWISDWEGRTSTDPQGLAWPRQVGPLAWALVFATLFLVAARARRFGRLATEPLPVVVKSIESTQSLATLYRRSKARDAAAAALQEGTASRLGRRLGIPRAGLAPTEYAEAVRSALPDEHRDAGTVLTARPPTSDADLVALAHHLDALEKEIVHD